MKFMNNEKWIIKDYKNVDYMYLDFICIHYKTKQAAILHTYMFSLESEESLLKYLSDSETWERTIFSRTSVAQTPLEP